MKKNPTTNGFIQKQCKCQEQIDKLESRIKTLELLVSDGYDNLVDKILKLEQAKHAHKTVP